MRYISTPGTTHQIILYKQGLKKVIKTFINYCKAAVTTITALSIEI